MSFALRDGLYSGVRASPQAAGAAIRTTQSAPSTATQSAPGAARGAALGSRENRAARKAAGLYPRAWVGPPRSRIAITTGLPLARPGNPRGGEPEELSCFLVVVRPKDRSVEQQLARIASKNHGVVTRRDLARAGITGAEIKHRVGVGALIRVHWGVYRVGHRAPSLESRYLAAVRACGEEAVLSGRAAGYYLGILKGGPPPPEVTGPTERRVRGVKTRRSLLDPRDITVVRGIAVTTVPRTVVDLAAVLDEDDLVRAYHEADVRYGTTPIQIEVVLERCRKAPGAPKLRRVI